MTTRNVHRWIGLGLLLPMFGWAITGIIFFIKPGYQGAYQQLSIKTYPVEIPLVIKPQNGWQDVKLIKTVLGHHLLVKINDQQLHLDPVSLKPKLAPSQSQLQSLIADATAFNLARYGKLIKVTDSEVITSTGITINFNWQNLSLRQMGRDTELINLMYKIHYLQWTNSKAVNQFLGIFGLVLLMLLSLLGAWLVFKKPSYSNNTI